MVEIRRVNHQEEVEPLATLFRICFGRHMPTEYWEWKYVQNPAVLSDPTVVVAVDEDRIIGARPFQFTEMWLGNKRVIVAQHTDTMVHPEYRDRGIFHRMAECADTGRDG